MRFLCLGVLLLGSVTAFGVINDIPVGGGFKTIKENSILKPYKTTESYVYAKGAIFERWVFNPWVKLDKTENGVSVALLPSEQDQGYVSLEATASVASLEDDKKYTVEAEIAYDCKTPAVRKGELPLNCRQEYVVRCYGYQNGNWSAIIDKNVRLEESKSPGIFKVSGIEIDKERCASGVSLVLKGHLDKGVEQFVFKEMKLGFQVIK